MKKRWLAVVLLLPALALADTVVYRWVDKNGVVHYSDQPHPGAVKVNLSAPAVVNFKTPPASSVPQPPAQAPAAASAPTYQIAILAPSDGTTLRPADNEVPVRVSVQPPLGPAVQLQYALDGKPAGPPTSATDVMLQNVYRGTHVLTVTALADGKTVGSATSTFYVHQHSILHRRGGSQGRPGR